MSLTVREVFEEYSELTPKDKDLPGRIVRFKQNFINKNAEHTEFFGGNLIGYPSIRWTDRDTKAWLEEVLLVEDIKSCQEDLYECDGINKEYNVSSNIFNLSIPWVMNILWRQNSNIKSYRPGMEAALIVGMAFHLSTFMVRRFPYKSNPDIALSMFEKLNNRFDFKVEGSWIGLLTARTDIFMDTKGKYPDVWQEMVNDLRTVVMCNEVNGNIRKTVNILTELYHKEKEANERILKTKKLGDLDGESVIKDYIRKSDTLKRDMVSLCSDAPSLIKTEILEVIIDLYPNVDERALEDTLRYLSDNMNGRDKWYQYIELFSVFMLELVRRKKVDFSSVSQTVTTMVSLFRSSSTKNQDVLDIKKAFNKIVSDANPGESKNKIPSTVSGLIAYLTVRMLAINYYR